MKSVGRRLLSSVCAFALAANGVAGVMAQDRKSDIQIVAVRTGAELTDLVTVTATKPTSDVIRAPEVFSSGLGNAAQQGGDSVFQFFSLEMSFDNRLVTGAPISADVVSETIQTMPDGNRIVQRIEGRIYRDSQGRTRHERTFQMGGTNEQKQTINIFDPVSVMSYTLDPEARTARKTNSYIRVAPPLPPPPPRFVSPAEAPKKVTVASGVLHGNAIKKVQPPYPPVAKAAGAEGPVQVQVLIGETGEVLEATAISGHPLLREAVLEAARQWQFKPVELSSRPVKVQGVLTFNFTIQKKEIAGDILQGNAIKKVQPAYPLTAKAAGAEGAVQVQVNISETGEVFEATVVSGHPLLRDAALKAARQWLFKPTEVGGRAVKTQGILTFNFTLENRENTTPIEARRITKYSTNTEPLGKLGIEGVECEGTRAVTTMPAGAIGNERPIETVNETWYSPELKMMILSKRSDPRFGESTYRVTNINRSEPDAALFQVPSGYTIIDGGLETDIKKIEEMRRKVEELRKPNNQ
ncbi:MAG: energy transducer TonB [Blastocatellia bacterium]